MPNGNLADASNVYGYSVAILLAVVLKQCGDDLTRENVMKQAASLKGVELRCCCPASRSTPARPTSIRSRRCSWRASRARSWELFGDILSNEAQSQ